MAVHEFRVALTVEDFDSVTRFYRDGLGLEPEEIWTHEGSRGQMFLAGRATLEIFEPGYADHVDELEVGSRVSGQIRFAFQVPDLQKALGNALDFGAALVAEPKMTPWGDLNARVLSPEGLQITLYQVNSSPDKFNTL